MRTLPRPLIGALLVFGVALTIVAGLMVRDAQRRQRAAVPMPAPLVALTDVVYTESEVRDRDIEFYARRAHEDRQSASDRLTLATLLFRRSRIAGSATDLAQAESLARKSVSLREQRNGQAFQVLATILMARHAFREARDIAQRADSLEPGRASHLALLAEIELELGDYDAAATHFKAVHYDGKQFTVGARMARWYEVTGRAEIARSILEKAIVEVDRRDDLPREQVAWFHYRLGELHLRVGNLPLADSAFERALQRNPDDVRALGGLTRTALARRDWERAIQYGERATGVQLDPTTLGAVSRAYAALGDSVQAGQFAKAMSVSALAQPEVIHRAWGLFLLDHGSPAERREVLRRARRELKERQDVYGHDLLAWALFRSGRVEEARREMALALAQRTEDVMLTAHARAIAKIPPARDAAP